MLEVLDEDFGRSWGIELVAPGGSGVKPPEGVVLSLTPSVSLHIPVE